MGTLPSYLFPILDTIGLAPSSACAVAVSGGSDSMALTLLLQSYAASHGHALTALTVDHGLRAGSADEARQVAAWMQAHGIAHRTLSCPAIDSTRNLQAHAREARYTALCDWCCGHGIDALFIAQHADDQAETVALQQHRGNTPPSRAGMAFITPRGTVRLIRPLLGVRKASLQAYLQAQSQPWIEDPSNQSDRHARNRLRKTMDDVSMRRLWLEAQRMGEARQQEDSARNAWLASHAQGQDDGTYILPCDAWRALPATLRTDVLTRIMRVAGRRLHRPRMHETARLDARLETEPHGKATLGGTIIIWDASRNMLQIAPEHALDVPDEPPHMEGSGPARSHQVALEAPPFWWFNHEPYF